MIREHFTGTGPMLRLILRRDRIRLPIWVLAIVGVVHASAETVHGLYTGVEERLTYAETVGASPAAIIMSGPPVALDSIGGIVVFEVDFVAVIAVGLMAVFLTVRHTRAEEEAGRAELLRAAVLGRIAPVAAAALAVSGASVLVGAGAAASFLAVGLPETGSLVYGASLAALGICFTLVALVAAQVMEHARTALTASAAILAASFVLRGAGDVGEKALTWMSPIGWVQATHPFGDNRVWPLALVAGLCLVLAVATVVLMRHRDMGAGLVAPRLGPAEASPRLRGTTGFAFRMQRGSVAAWSIGALLLGLAFGAFGREVTQMAEGNPQLAEILASGGGSGRLVDAFFTTALNLQALLAAGFTLGSVLRLRGAERSGQAELLLTTGQPRARWASTWLLVTALGTLAIVAAGGIGLGLAHSVAADAPGRLPGLIGAALAYAPASLVLGSVGALLFGWAPRASAAAWAVLAGCFVVGWLGDPLQLPGWLIDLSPFQRVPQLSRAALDWTPITAMSAVAVALAALALPGLLRRDIG